MTCPRCGREPPPGAAAGPFCPYCGRFRTATRWVASPPGHRARPAATAPRRRYTGPPWYPVTPRWGFPPLPWRPASGPAARGSRPRSPAAATRLLAACAVPLLWATALLAATAAGAEIWRYVLLLRSRADALPAGEVAANDGLVLASGTGAVIIGLCAGALLVTWSLRAGHAAADGAQVQPSRSDRSILLGWLLPGVNLSVPGSVLAEIEHAALHRPAGARPRPSRLLLCWWGLWVGSVLLTAITLLWGLRDGLQARADGVVLHAWLDLLAVATAIVTVRVVTMLTDLLAPDVRPRRMLLVKVLPAAPRRSTTVATR